MSNYLTIIATLFSVIKWFDMSGRPRCEALTLKVINTKTVTFFSYSHTVTKYTVRLQTSVIAQYKHGHSFGNINIRSVLPISYDKR